MFAILVAMALSQNPWQWANDPTYYAGPVIDYCRNGASCNLSGIIVRAPATPATVAPVQIISPVNTKYALCMQNPTSAVSFSRNAQYFDIGVSSTCQSAFFAYPIQIDTTSLRVITGSNTTLLMDGFSSEATFPNPNTGKGFTAASSSKKLYISDTNQWKAIGTGKHPVQDKSTYVYGWKAANPNYEGDTFVDETFTGVTQTEACAAGTIANVVTMPVGFGTEVGFGRSFTTQAAINATCGDSSSSAFTKVSNSRPIEVFRIKSDAANVSSTRMIAGLGVASIFTAPSDTPASEGAWFRYSTVAGDSNLMACSSNGAAATCTSTGVAYTTGTTYLLMIDASENGAVTFWINGLPRVRQTTNLPDSTAIGQGVVIQATTAAARTLIVSRRVFELSR